MKTIGLIGDWEMLRRRVDATHAHFAGEFSDEVRAVAAKVGPTGRRGERKVFLAEVRKHPSFASMPRPVFDAKLLEARKSGKLSLSRADLVGDDYDRIRESAVKPIGGDLPDEVHFVDAEPHVEITPETPKAKKPSKASTSSPGGTMDRRDFLAVERVSAPGSRSKVFVHYPSDGLLRAEKRGLIRRVETSDLGAIRFERTEAGHAAYEADVAAKRARYKK